MLPQVSPVVTQPNPDNLRTLPTLAQRAGATRKRRHAAGRYASPAQKAAYAKLLTRDGRKMLTLTELQDLATHPGLAPSQREEFSRLAVQARIDGDGCIATMPTSSHP
jgi:hypothetical protein